MNDNSDTPVEAFGDGALDLLDLVLTFRPLYQNLPFIRDFRKMTYEEAIAYFVNNKPPEQFEKGVMLLEKNPGEPYVFFTQLFLNKSNQPICHPVTRKPYGRRCLIRSLDDELTHLFGSKKIIIVQ